MKIIYKPDYIYLKKLISILITRSRFASCKNLDNGLCKHILPWINENANSYLSIVFSTALAVFLINRLDLLTCS
jgi:hypothetical protein